jgi:hypothetical protein
MSSFLHNPGARQVEPILSQWPACGVEDVDDALVIGIQQGGVVVGGKARADRPMATEKMTPPRSEDTSTQVIMPHRAAIWLSQ